MYSSTPSFGFGFSALPSLEIVSSGSIAPTVVLYSNSTVLGSVTIGANTTLDTNGNFLVVAGNATTPGDWTNNGTFTDATGGVTLNGAAGQTIGGSNISTFNYLFDENTSSSGVILAISAAVINDLSVSAGSLLNASVYDITVGGVLYNDGMLRQIKNVDGTSDISFFQAGNYGGVVLNANGTSLGLTTVSIWGNHDCTLHVNETVKRCFYIDPANPSGQNATITFFFNNSEIVGTFNACNTLDAYRNVVGNNWGTPLIIDTSYSGGRICGADPQSLRVKNVTSFSPFALRSANAPTVINLNNLTAQSNARIPVGMVAVALGFLFMSGGQLYLRRRKVQ